MKIVLTVALALAAPFSIILFAWPWNLFFALLCIGGIAFLEASRHGAIHELSHESLATRAARLLRLDGSAAEQAHDDTKGR